MPQIETVVVLWSEAPFSALVFDKGDCSVELGPEWGPIGSEDGLGRTGGFPNPTKFDIANEGLLMMAVEVLRRENTNEDESGGVLETNPDASNNRLIEVKNFLVAEGNIGWKRMGRDVSEIFLGNWDTFNRQPLSDGGAVFLAAQLSSFVGLAFLDVFEGGAVDEGVRGYFPNWGFQFKWVPITDQTALGSVTETPGGIVVLDLRDPRGILGQTKNPGRFSCVGAASFQRNCGTTLDPGGKQLGRAWTLGI